MCGNIKDEGEQDRQAEHNDRDNRQFDQVFNHAHTTHPFVISTGRPVRSALV